LQFCDRCPAFWRFQALHIMYILVVFCQIEHRLIKTEVPFFKKNQAEKSKSAKNQGGGRDTSWGGISSWYDETVEKENSYQKELILPNLLRLLDIKKGEKIIDIACGQGFFAREYSKHGASVAGTDISPELISIANERSQGSGAVFNVSSANKQQFPNSAFDKASCILALQDIEDLNGTIFEVGRLLKPGGLFVAVINHPAFRVPKRSSWVVDEKNKIQFRRVDEYISETKVKFEVHPGSTSSPQADQITTYFHRPLQSYFKALEKAGLAVVRLEEWVSNKESQPGPRSDMENKARREFPLFMALVARH